MIKVEKEIIKANSYNKWSGSNWIKYKINKDIHKIPNVDYVNFNLYFKIEDKIITTRQYTYYQGESSFMVLAKNENDIDNFFNSVRMVEQLVK